MFSWGNSEKGAVAFFTSKQDFRIARQKRIICRWFI